MFSHIMLGVDDLESGKRFYDALLGQLGIAPGVTNKKRFAYRSPTGMFVITIPLNGAAATAGNGSTTGFAAQSPEQVNAAHAAGLAAGGVAIEDAPGWRGEGPGALYLAYLRDPAGNKICLLHRPAQA